MKKGGARAWENKKAAVISCYSLSWGSLQRRQPLVA